MQGKELKLEKILNQNLKDNLDSHKQTSIEAGQDIISLTSSIHGGSCSIVAGGNIEAKWQITSRADIYAKQNIETSCGDILAGESLKAEKDILSARIISANSIEAGSCIEATKYIKSKSHIHACHNIKTKGYIKAKTEIKTTDFGDIDAGLDIKSKNGSIKVDGLINSGKSIKAKHQIFAANDIVASDCIMSFNDEIKSCRSIKAGKTITAGLSISCEGSLHSGLRIFAGLITEKIPTEDEMEITCQALESGKVCFGKLIETGGTVPRVIALR
jgi:hypothetical protein